MMKLSVRDMTLAALFTALTVVGAKINFLLPDIPVTLQPIIVMLAGSLLGSKTALLSQIVYITIGLMGIPVFAKPIAGPAYIFTPSFGYLIGFAAGAYVVGFIVEKSGKKSLPAFLAANFAGLAVIYFFGILYFYGLMNLYMGNPVGLTAAAAMMLPFMAKDAVLGFVVSVLAFNVYHRIKSQLINAY